MSSEWIKMRTNLWDDPRVAALVDATDSSEAAIVGGLYWLWASADEHSEDGYMPGLSLRQIDRKTGIPGFGAALIAIGWIAQQDDGVSIVRFEDHNGSSAKRRASESRRKMSARDADKVRTNPGRAAHLEEEEEEEEQKQEQKQQRVQPAAAPSRFAEFWAAYPNPKAKKVAKAIWDRRKLDSRCDELIAHVRLMVESDDDWRRGYVPMGSTYLNQDRWEDIPKQRSAAGPPSAQPPSKTLAAIQKLQGMKHGNVDPQRNHGRPEPPALPEP